MQLDRAAGRHPIPRPRVRFPPVSVAASGMPPAAALTWCLLPDLPRSAGDAQPPSGAEVAVAELGFPASCVVDDDPSGHRGGTFANPRSRRGAPARGACPSRRGRSPGCCPWRSCTTAGLAAGRSRRPSGGMSDGWFRQRRLRAQEATAANAEHGGVASVMQTC